MSQLQFKVVLLGEGRVGKTSIMIRYVDGTYQDRRESTVNASYLEKTLTINNHTTATVSIWDTAGQERFHSLGPIYYRDADGAVVVYDITDAESFNRVKVWTRELRKMVGGEDDISIAIVGNKTDLESERQISEGEAVEYAKSVGAEHFQTSAKMNRGVDGLFEELTKRMIDRHKNKPKRSVLGEPATVDSASAGRSRQKLIILAPGDEETTEGKKTCCY